VEVEVGLSLLAWDGGGRRNVPPPPFPGPVALFGPVPIWGESGASGMSGVRGDGPDGTFNLGLGTALDGEDPLPVLNGSGEAERDE